VKHCLSEEDYNNVDSDIRHSDVDNEDDNDNTDDTPFDPYAFDLKVNDNDVVEKKKSKSLALENGSETCLKDVSAKILKAEFIHTLLLPKRLNAKLETLIESTCE